MNQVFPNLPQSTSSNWRHKKFYIIFVIFLLSLLVFLYKDYQHFKEKKYNFEITVKKWDSILSVKNKLCKTKVLNNCLFADIFFYFNWPDKIIPWNYNLKNVSLSWLFQQLKKWPPINYTKFTIIPWYTIFDIAAKLEKYNSQNKKIFLNLAHNKTFIKQLQSNYPTLKKFWDISSIEWFLYPDTYFFKKSDLTSELFPQLLIKTAVKNFVKKTKNLSWKNPYKLTPYQVLILASIVQKEEFNSKNKPLIADILIRRFKDNWKLWADWTLCYWLKIASNKCKNYLYNKYLLDKSNPYNTRSNKWLPPTPVWNQTLDSIKAVLNPQKNNYWYYLHDKNWKIHFAKTENEHILNKYRYLR